MSARRLLVSTAGALAVASVATAQTANLAEVMRAILLPNSNVIFAAQHDDFAAVTSDPDPSLATDPFKGVYGGWQAVDNAGIALVEATRLLTVPRRLCSNGKQVPVREAEFLKMVDDLRSAGLAASSAARSQNHERILDAGEKVSAACSRCHLRYREKGGEDNRCAAISPPGAPRAPAARTSSRPAPRSAVRR
jgi:hypothetical protein